MFSLSSQTSKWFKKPLAFASGDLAKQANGSVTVTFGETVVLATACMSPEPRVGDNFLPLMVDYQAKTYAMGKIPGGYIKREGRPKDDEMLCARLIDRPLRPLFPAGFTNEVQIVAMVLSSDGENSPDVLAVNAASCALLISDIPFTNPVAAVRVARVDGNFVINPTYDERDKSSFDIVIVSTREKVVMIEGKFSETSEREVFEAIQFAAPAINEILDIQDAFQKKAGKAKKDIPLHTLDEAILKTATDKVGGALEKMYATGDNAACEETLKSANADLQELFKDKEEVTPEMIREVIHEIEKRIVRRKIVVDSSRPDGRAIKEIRPITCVVGALPRTHGSAVFTRGQTQSLSIVTLGTSSDEQKIEALEGETKKRFMLHYAFPPFSVGEVRFMRGPSRREIGHGALAEKAIDPVIPEKEIFPYAIRIVSEILESNGSSSMATVCASSLALMDAGVPIREQVAGIAMGLVEEDGKAKVLTDIAGAEDHYGDMDFKVAGTKKGITAIQLDVKNDGLTLALIQEILDRAKEARFAILEKMNAALNAPRGEVSAHAPKIKTFKIEIDKIGEVIGPGGRVIRRLSREHDVTIDIDDEEGMVSVVATDPGNLERAVNEIQMLVKEIGVGEFYDAKVTKLTNFGAFCELAPGRNGLVHISEVSNNYVKDIRDVLKEGDRIRVKVVGIDAQGRINLSKKQAE